MNCSIDMTLRESLKAIYGEQEAVKALLDSFAVRRRDVAETTVIRATQLTGLEYGEMLQALRSLAEAGAGDFKVGRKGAKSRIEWNYGVRSLAAAAIGEGQLVKLEQEGVLEADGPEVDDDEDIAHEYVLRPGKRIRFFLPSDLTQREAGRLADFITSLPFEVDTQN